MHGCWRRERPHLGCHDAIRALVRFDRAVDPQPAWPAAAIWGIAALPAGERRGCWHLAGAERLSRFEIARRMVDRLHLPGAIIESAAQPDNCDRPRDIAFTDVRARAMVGWRPSPIA